MPELPDLCHKVVLAVKSWNWSWMCCWGQGNALLVSGQHEVDSFIAVNDAFRDLGWQGFWDW